MELKRVQTCIGGEARSKRHCKAFVLVIVLGMPGQLRTADCRLFVTVVEGGGQPAVD